MIKIYRVLILSVDGGRLEIVVLLKTIIVQVNLAFESGTTLKLWL